MKRLFSLSVCLTIAMLSFAHDFYVDGIYYNITSSSEPYTVAVTYKGTYYDEFSGEYTGDVIIPESITYDGKTYSVTSIGRDAFYNCSGLTSIDIGNGVTSIGYAAFMGCRGLTSIIIGNNLKSINSDAFYNCNSLTSVTVHCQHVGHWFNGFSTIKEVIIGDEVTSIDVAFRNTTWYNNLPDGLIYIGKVAYTYKGTMPENTAIVLEDGTTGIAGYAFKDCKGLASIEIPNSVTNIGSSAFSGCNGLTSITIPNSVTSIGSSAFSNCSGLTSVTIGNSVTSIGGSAFQNCFSLTSVTIGNSVTSIGDRAFEDCSGLTSITIPSSVTSIGNSAFWNTPWYNNQPDGLVYAGKVVYEYKGTMPENTAIVLEEGTTGIAGSAFSGCSGLTSITIPNSVTTIGYDAFHWCSGLTSIEIPNSVTNIGTGAFYSCYNLESISLGNNILSLSLQLNDPDFSHESDVSNIKKNLKILVSKNSATFINLWNKYLFTDGGTYRYYNDYLYDKESGQKIKTFYENVTATSIRCPHVESNEYIDVISQTDNIHGLKPNTDYENIEYKGEFKDKYGKVYSINTKLSVYAYTKQLVFDNNMPKGVSSGNVIVSTKTNVDEAEENVGFEWRRSDWTDDFVSKSGPGVIYDGVLEGLIRNLNADKLWKCRAFYQANDGTMFYGDWIGVDPSDFSYFEPTVHTYANTVVAGNDATLTGSVIAGSDNVIEQGFEYWLTETNHARSEGGVTALDIMKVISSGQRMSANISGLKRGATYKYRAYVKTAKGTTYGEEQEFKVPGTTGIEAIENSQSTNDNAVSRRVKGIYTLTGVKVSDDAADVKTLKSGIYIVNGKKVAVK